MIHGETIATGAEQTCRDCRVTPKLQVCRSPGSLLFYLGTYCKCGPYSRETGYFGTRKEAEAALKDWELGDRTGIRT